MPDLPKLYLLDPEELALSADTMRTGPPVLETPVLRPIDLTRSHSLDITAERLTEMAGSYDPAIETASLNFDHAWGGASLGHCERVWVQEDGHLWVRYINLAEEAVEGIRSGKWTRRSLEFVTNHPVTGGWYLTGLALLGNARPAVPGLPPITLMSRFEVITGAPAPTRKETQMSDPAIPGAPAPPAADASPPAEERVVLSMREASELRNGLATLAKMRVDYARLAADESIRGLGSRVTPAMRRELQPLLVHLLAAEEQDVVTLSVGGKDTPVTLSEAILRVLRAAPEFTALGLGQIATEDEPEAPDTRTSDVAALHAAHGITPERLTQLQGKFGMKG